MVYWDQRGAGLSYSSHMDKSTLTIDQYINDTIAVTNYLRERFGQDKIYLMAHSWGTYLTEKINLWRGKLLLNKNSQLKKNDDLRDKVTTLDVPTYFISGLYDYTVNYIMAEEYLMQLEAPIKGFYLFKNSAHSPIFEEPDKVAQIVNSDILINTNDLSDIK